MPLNSPFPPFYKREAYENDPSLRALVTEINELKAKKGAIILAHSYVHPEIVYGVADFRGDSYGLSLEAKKANADIIVFAGVVFMAETAKILSPKALVLIPDREAGCSLADSITKDGLIELKAQYPDAATVCYINSRIDVKAESDVCVTSTNALEIIKKLPQRRILFVPDRLMAQNIRRSLAEQQIDKEVFYSKGSCEVHDHFNPAGIEEARCHFPDLKVVSHPECSPEITQQSDFVGSTGKMMDYVRQTKSRHFMMLTECGLVDRLEAETKDKVFISSCMICPHMKRNTLNNILSALKNPTQEQIIEVDEEIRVKAKRSLDRMFELSVA